VVAKRQLILPIRWRIAQLFFAVYHVSLIIIFFRSVGPTHPHVTFDRVVTPFGAVVLLGQFATAAGLFAAFLPAVYYAALVLLLFVSAYQFAILLLGDAV
jgi:hypothetical protein